MHIHYGYDIDVACAEDTALTARLDVHPSLRHDITSPDTMTVTGHRDGGVFSPGETSLDAAGNILRRLVVPAGGALLSCSGVIHHSGFAEEMPYADGRAVPESLPAEVLPYLEASPLCDPDKLPARALKGLGDAGGDVERVEAVCDFVHAAVRFDPGRAGAARPAEEVFEERAGASEDFAHLAIGLCRALGIPARYCTGYLGWIGVPEEPYPMAFRAWFEAYVAGGWWTFDPTHNTPRIGRILIARGRDAADVPILRGAGSFTLERVNVVIHEAEGSRYPVSAAERRDHDATRSRMMPT